MPVEEFDADYFTRLREAQGHWWVRGMREVADALMGPTGGDLAVLDAGCGVGTNLAWLRGFAGSGRLVGFDVAPPAVAHAARLDIADVVAASATALPFAGASFDLVASMDVLQHLSSDAAAAALGEVRRVLRPGGRALIRTNAAFGRAAVQERDDWRLYRPESLASELTSAGLTVERLTPVNFLQGLYSSLPVLRRGRSGGEHGDHDRGQGHGLGIPRPTSPLRNAALLRVTRAEARWLARADRRLPFGHSLYAIARRAG